MMTGKDWSWISECNLLQGRPVAIPDGLYFLWSTISTLKERYNIATLDGRVGLTAWWLVNGFKEFPAIDIKIVDHARLHESAQRSWQEDAFRVSHIMLASAELNDTLMRSIDLSNRYDRAKLANWYFTHVIHGATGFSVHELSYLHSDAVDIEQDTVAPITRAMWLCWNLRDDIRSLYDLGTASGRLGFEGWWMSRGHKDSPPYVLSDIQLQEFEKPAPGVVQDARLPIINTMLVCRNHRDEIRELSDLTTPEGRGRLVDWWCAAGYDVSPPYTKESEQDDDAATADADIASRLAEIERVVASGYQENGINLIGLAKGELGIGEDVRMAARAIETAGVPYSIFNFPKTSMSRQKDMSLVDRVQDELVYKNNMVNLTGFEHASLFTQYGKRFFDDRFTIGAWPWELPCWPRLLDTVYRLVDEIWASSRYAVEAYRHADVPVIHMPMTVDFKYTPSSDRSVFGLPDDTYLFLYVFDSFSYMARKNPVAHIEAFWKAFPRNRKDVGLVVKTMNANMENSTWLRFQEMVSQDDRIFLISETLEKRKVLDLMNCCDAFLSLHRSEGFGRCVAEMMWLGKPAITTGFSGNMDFTTEQTAFLVDGSRVAVREGEYPFAENQYWCEPDVTEAAGRMQQCVEGAREVKLVADRGRDFVREHYSFEAVSKKYRDRLEYLGII